MARSKGSKIELTAYDDLFETDESRAEAALSKLRDIPISEIDEFPDHPFKVLMDEDMEQLVDSIKRNGVMTPATVRLKEDGRYELISGHRRKKACELAGLETLKCEVKELTRDEAVIVMVESNLQRSVILPSEKAYAYKMRLEAMKRQAGRPVKDNYSPVGNNLEFATSSDELAEKVGESKNQIFRYIRLTELVFQILTSLSISLINNAAADYGDAAIAGMGVVTRLVSMGSLTIFGFIKGFQPIAGYSYGAKKFNRLHEAIKTSIIWSTVFCVVYGLILALFSTSIVSQFASGNLEMIKVGASSLRVNGISLMLFGFYTVYSSLFLALGKGKEGFILGACRQGICFVPVILVLPMIWGLNGILYAQPVADVLSAIITIFMAIHLHRELNEAEKQAAIAGTNEVH